MRIVTAFDCGYLNIGQNCEETGRRYARRWGCEFRSYPVPESFDRPPAWFKIRLLLEILEETDWVLWVDADAAFAQIDEDILLNTQDDKDLYMVFHRFPVTDVGPGVRIYLDRPNTGVMLWRNSEWSRSFLHEIWSSTDWLREDNKWFENAAVLDLMGLRAEFFKDWSMNEPVKAWCEKIKPLPLRWNAVPTAYADNCLECFDPVIVHAAGLALEEKAAFLKKRIASQHSLV